MQTYDYLIWLAGGLTALGVIISTIFKAHKYILKIDNLEVEKQEIINRLDKNYAKIKSKFHELESHHETDMKLIKKEESAEFREVQEEQQILMIAVLACLKALRDGASNGEVDQAITQIEQHLIKKAHD